MTFYIVETLQVSSGTFMGSTNVQYSTVDDARLQAQRESNYYGTITRVVLVDAAPGQFAYTICVDHYLTHADYFYPQPFQTE